MSGYSARYARLYDLFYGDKPYLDEAGFAHDRFAELGLGPSSALMDIACGTGRHALAFDSLGYRVVGMDRSEGMISVARDGAARAGVGSRFIVGDMRRLPLATASFDCCVCLFDSIGYALTDAGVEMSLRGMARTLRPDGALILEFLHAPAMLSSFDPYRERLYLMPDGEIIRIAETQVSERDRVAKVHYTVRQRRSGREYETFSELQMARFFHLDEMHRFLRRVGLSPVRDFAGFSTDSPVRDETWHVVTVARR